MNEAVKIKRFYNQEEIESMNMIFGKNPGNNWFSRDELSFANEIDLFDFDLEQVKMDWKSNFAD